MSIRDIRPGSAHLDASSLDAARKTRTAAQTDGRAEASRAAAPAAGQDRLELSDAARAHQHAADDVQPEMERARKALLGIPPLDPKRAEDILLRIREGHYSQPEIVKQIASRVASELAGQFPDEA